MSSIYEWLTEYHKFHRNPMNKLIHWVCVPVIIFSIFGLLSLIEFSVSIQIYSVVFKNHKILYFTDSLKS